MLASNSLMTDQHKTSTAPSKGTKILVVEDDLSVCDMVGFSLKSAGFSASTTNSAEQAMQALESSTPDLIVLDWMLPGCSGLEMARKLKSDEFTRDIPIIMLTARGEEDDRVAGLDAGIDDFVVKPFSPRELNARIRAVLRRTAPEQSLTRMSSGIIEIEPGSHRVRIHGENVKFGPTEYGLLKFFAEHPERVFSRAQLLDQVWGRNTYVEERTVDVHILRLRKTLKSHGADQYIQTVRGAGYRYSTEQN